MIKASSNFMFRRQSLINVWSGNKSVGTSVGGGKTVGISAGHLV
jgi:hypothetical protein